MLSWVQTAARDQPDRAAVIGSERSLTYAELLGAARGAEGELAAMGARPGDRVALALAPGEDFVVALHACWLSGMAVVPVDLRWSAAERRARLAGAAVLVSEPLGSSRGAPVDGRLVANPDLPVAVVHTSGTTAAPKPVLLTYGNFTASALGSAVALGIDRRERWLCPMPLAHVGGLSIPVRCAIYGATVVLHGRFQVDAVLEELMDPARRITLVSLVPTMLARLLDAGLARPPTLRWALLGGGPLPQALLARARAAEVPVAPTYGMTEACSQIATFGYPLPGVVLRIDESSGELLVRGEIVAPGARSADGWLHTGDLGRFAERGRLQIVGRQSDTIISGGENVAPAEIEAVLLEHPAVADAAVFGRADPEWGEAVCAIVVPRDGGAVELDELRELCVGRLAGFKVPKHFSVARSLPRTSSGKLLRRQLG